VDAFAVIIGAIGFEGGFGLGKRGEG